MYDTAVWDFKMKNIIQTKGFLHWTSIFSSAIYV